MKWLCVVSIALLALSCSADRTSLPPPPEGAESWSPVGDGLPGPVTCLCATENQLIAATVSGTSLQREGILWSWNGATWDQISTPLAGGVSAMAWYGGALFVGGGFDLGGDPPARALAQWNGSAWIPVGSPLEDHGFCLCATVTCMTHWRGKLVFGGLFKSFSNVATWDGTKIEFLDCNLIPQTLEVWRDTLLVGGPVDSDMGCDLLGSRLLAWRDDTWIDFEGGIHPFPEGCPPQVTVSEILATPGDLVVAGRFSGVGGSSVQNVAAWDGQTWRSLGASASNVASMLYWNDHLLAAEYGEHACFVRRWNGQDWEPVGNAFDGSVNDIVVFDGYLYAAGDFASYAARIPFERLDE